ncbi:zinc-dependent alcohol dehydrogenase [Thiorhodococcus minor]|uniref:Zinc-binding alcohol dehydrogenase n=1 Tax=Thiorhodococcus minor TaxID=57489 RepID=A0A6M0JWF9_9GAMM|nr:zinc-binding alcohol dehydrogenase [Thiorhodococcus minor]NEV61840.1 zinc-binding alcohol dehydrogenase [Thiorhodococcus minor]
MNEPTQTLAFWVTAPGQGELREEPLPKVAPGQVRVRASYGAISRGTEALVFRGEVPASEHQRMRAPFQEGDFSFPVKYGYCSVGEVEEGPADLLGRSVFCLYPHQAQYVVPAEAVVPLPHEVPPERAILAANMETAVNGLWDATPRIGDRIAVIGAGTVGCLVAWLAGRIPGCEVELIDVDPGKAGVAEALGLGFALPEQARGEADLVIHTSGSPAGLVTALGLAGRESTVVEMSWYGARPATLPLGEAFHQRRLTLRSSQVGGLPPSQAPRWTLRRRLQTALPLLADPRLDVLITGSSAFTELPAVMARLVEAPQGTICHRIHYSRG